jgi:hypothetical protein
MTNQLITLLIITLLACFTAAQGPIVNVPRCEAGRTDPGTGRICGRRLSTQTTIESYGYDKFVSAANTTRVPSLSFGIGLFTP